MSFPLERLKADMTAHLRETVNDTLDEAALFIERWGACPENAGAKHHYDRMAAGLRLLKIGKHEIAPRKAKTA